MPQIGASAFSMGHICMTINKINSLYMPMTGVVKNRKALIKTLGALLVTSMLIGVSYYAVSLRNNQDPLEARLNECALGKDLAIALREDASYECFKNLILDAARTGRTIEMQDILLTQTIKNPYLYYACHDALHAIGAIYYEDQPDIGKTIRETPREACGYAFIHGNIDAFGKSDPNAKQMLEASKACASMDNLGEDSRIAGLCYHGLGHAAWLAKGIEYPTLEAAAESKFDFAALENALMLCESVLLQAKSSCGDGILMDIYLPVNGIGRGLVNGKKELPKLCDEYWKVSDELLGGCYSGSVYIVNTDFGLLLEKISSREESRNKLTKEDSQAILTIFNKTIDMCDALQGPYTESHNENITPKDQCYSAVEREVLNIIYTDKTLLSAICSRLHRFEDWCLEEAAAPR